MVKTLRPIGNSLGLIIDKPILDLLKIDETTELEITTDGTRLIVAPVASKATRFRASAERMMKVHDRTLKKLAK